jgi:hypothetical protein
MPCAGLCCCGSFSSGQTLSVHCRVVRVGFPVHQEPGGFVTVYTTQVKVGQSLVKVGQSDSSYVAERQVLAKQGCLTRQMWPCVVGFVYGRIGPDDDSLPRVLWMCCIVPTMLSVVCGLTFGMPFGPAS